MNEDKPILDHEEIEVNYQSVVFEGSEGKITCIHGKNPIFCCRLDSKDIEPHCHSTKKPSGVDKSVRKRLIAASLLCLIFMLVECVGGILAKSLAIAVDAAHLLTDFASFMISLFALWYGSRPATKRMSFGYYRAEVIGALTSVLLIWVVTGILVYLAIERLVFKTYEVDAVYMLITASFGVFSNVVMGIVLQCGGHGHTHGGFTHSHKHNNADTGDSPNNINVRAAFIHVLGDFVQSVGILIAATTIYFKPTWGFVDPICTFLFSILVLVTTITIIKDILNVLMEGLPKGIDFLEVRHTLASIPGVLKVHNLRIWSLSMDKIALSAHLAIGNIFLAIFLHDPSVGEEPTVILKKASQQLQAKFNIFDLTIQVEEFRQGMTNCMECQVPE